MKNKTAENLCPLCGANNNCMAHSEQPCWCSEVKIPRKLLELVPENKKGKACICLNCIESFKTNPSDFNINNKY